MRYSALALFLLASASCAGVSFESDDGRSGLLHYPPKPYVLVGRTGGSQKPVDISLIYLPDLSRPQYARYSAGWGSHEFSLKLKDGMLVEYGQKADSEIPKTLGAVSDLLGAAAGGYKTVTETILKTREESTAVGRIADALLGVADMLAGLRDGTARLQPADKERLTAVVARLQGLAALLNAPDGERRRDSSATELRALLESPMWSALRVADAGPAYDRGLDAAALALEAAIRRLVPEPAAPALQFDLYEVVIEDGRTRLRAVTFQ